MKDEVIRKMAIERATGNDRKDVFIGLVLKVLKNSVCIFKNNILCERTKTYILRITGEKVSADTTMKKRYRHTVTIQFLYIAKKTVMQNQREHPLYKVRDFDGIFLATWEMYKKYFTPLFLYAAIFSLVFSFTGMNIVDFEKLTDFSTEPDLELLRGMIGPIMLYFAVMIIGYGMLYLVMHYLIIVKESDPEKGHAALFGEVIGRFLLPYLLAVVVAGIIMFAGVFVGIFLLVIGSLLAAIYLGSVFLPITPVMIVEQRDPISTIGRCFNLVHKHFWPTMGQFLVFMVLFIIVSFVLGLLSSAPYIGSLFSVLSDPDAAQQAMESNRGMLQNNPLVILLGALVNGAMLPFMPAFSSVVYFNLRAREDEANPFRDS